MSVYVTMVLAMVGLTWVVNKAYTFTRMLVEVLFGRGVDINLYKARDNPKESWAVVTGSTDGIGKEFAMQLAKHYRYNIMMIARNEYKLQVLATELNEKYGVKTKWQVFDFAKPDSEEGFRELREKISKLDTSILINNVGTNHEIPTAFNGADSGNVADIMQVNCVNTVKLTKQMLEQMQRRSGPSLVLNIGSFAGTVATPYLAVYSASKAFLSTFSQAVATELALDKQNKVQMQCIHAYFVCTNMSKIRRSSVFVPTAAQYVKAVLGRVGLRCGTRLPYTSCPYPSHALLNWLIENAVPNAEWLINTTAQSNLKLRERALRKKGKAPIL